MIKGTFDFDITENAKELLISKLMDELIFLRTKLGLSQDELSNLIGISRQTYSTLETKKRTMSWGTYLSLILIFDNNEQTHYKRYWHISVYVVWYIRSCVKREKDS